MAKESNKKENKKEEKVAKSDPNKKNKKSGFKDFKAELKKVVWPTPKELINSTTAVIAIVLITAVIVFGLDLLFESLNTYGIDKIRTMVSDSVNEEDVTDNQEIVLDTEESDTNVDETTNATTEEKATAQDNTADVTTETTEE